ncbi:MAG: Sir2 family NAD+-dependent deacetylase [Planctomycetota bacterium]
MSAPRTIVILTGAGISAESGLKTFRAADGLWENHRVEDVATPEAFERNPALVLRFYNERRRQVLSSAIQPNPAHEALARWEREHPGDFLLVTQNIDNLHERAGSQRILHMHGEILKMRCSHSGRVDPIEGDMDSKDLCACCKRPGTLRPHIVWFGEMPFGMDSIHAALSRCDLFVSIGTSGNVYPAAGLVQVARAAGARTVELNLEPSLGASKFHEALYGPASQVVPAFVQKTLS